MEKPSFLFVMIAVTVILMLFVTLIVAVILPLRIGPGRYFRCGTLNNLIQFTPVQPHTATFRTKINLHTLTLCYVQWYITNGTIHGSSSFWVKSFIDIYTVLTPVKPIYRAASAVIVIKFQRFVELRNERGGLIGISDCYLGIDEDGFSVR